MFFTEKVKDLIYDIKNNYNEVILIIALIVGGKLLFDFIVFDITLIKYYRNPLVISYYKYNFIDKYIKFSKRSVKIRFWGQLTSQCEGTIFLILPIYNFCTLFFENKQTIENLELGKNYLSRNIIVTLDYFCKGVSPLILYYFYKVTVNYLKCSATGPYALNNIEELEDIELKDLRLLENEDEEEEGEGDGEGKGEGKGEEEEEENKKKENSSIKEEDGKKLNDEKDKTRDSDKIVSSNIMTDDEVQDYLNPKQNPGERRSSTLDTPAKRKSKLTSDEKRSSTLDTPIKRKSKLSPDDNRSTMLSPDDNRGSYLSPETKNSTFIPEIRLEPTTENSPIEIIPMPMPMPMPIDNSNLMLNEEKGEKCNTLKPHSRSHSRNSLASTKSKSHSRRNSVTSTDGKKDKRRSRMLTDEEKEEKRRSRMLTDEEKKEKRRSRMLIDEENEDKRRSRTLTDEEKKEKKRSRMLTDEEKEEKRRPRMLTDEEKKRSRMMTDEEKKEKTKSKLAPITDNNNENDVNGNNDNVIIQINGQNTDINNKDINEEDEESDYDSDSDYTYDSDYTDDSDYSDSSFSDSEESDDEEKKKKEKVKKVNRNTKFMEKFLIMADDCYGSICHDAIRSINNKVKVYMSYFFKKSPRSANGIYIDILFTEKNFKQAYNDSYTYNANEIRIPIIIRLMVLFNAFINSSIITGIFAGAYFVISKGYIDLIDIPQSMLKDEYVYFVLLITFINEFFKTLIALSHFIYGPQIAEACEKKNKLRKVEKKLNVYIHTRYIKI